MEKYLDQWFYLETLYYKSEFQEVNNLESVHPDDRDFVKNNLTNTFYQCVGIEDEYLIVESKKYKLRIRPTVIKGFLPAPKFKWGEVVVQITKPKIKAIVDDFFWHQSKQMYLYYLSIDGRRKSKQYIADELTSANI